MNILKRIFAGIIFIPTMLIAAIPMFYYMFWYGHVESNLNRANRNIWTFPYMWAHCWLCLGGKWENQRW